MELSFLNQFFLFFTSLGILPLIIHFLLRKRRERILFSDITNIKLKQQETLKSLKLRELLLLLLRILIIIITALAFARPTLKGTLSNPEKDAYQYKTVITVIDNSLSMNQRDNSSSKLIYSKKKAQKIADLYNENNYHFFISNTEENYLQYYKNNSIIKEKTENLQGSFYPNNLVSKIAETVKFVKEKDFNRDILIYILSDFQDPKWSELQNIAENNPNINFILVSNNEVENRNLFLSGVSISKDLKNLNNFNIEFTVNNSSEKKAENRVIQIYLDNKAVYQDLVSLDGMSSQDMSYTFKNIESGRHKGYIQIEDDYLDLDNKFYFAWNIKKTKNILVVYDNEKDNYFLDLALQNQDNENIIYNPIYIPSYELVSYPFVKDISLIIFNNVKNWGSSADSKIENLAQTKPLLFFVGDNTDISFYNSSDLFRKHNLKFSNPVGTFDKENFYTVESIIPGNTIFSFRETKEDKTDLFAQWKIYRAHNLVKGDFKTLIGLNDNIPLLSEVNKDFLIFTSLLNLEYGNIILKSDYLPFFYSLLNYLTDENFIMKWNYILDPIPAGNAEHLIMPSGKKYELSGDSDYFTDTFKPGIYSFYGSGILMGEYSVNIQAEESGYMDALSRLDRDNIHKITDKSLSDGADIGAYIKTLQQGRELWQYFAVTAFLLLVLEMLIAFSISSKNRFGN